MELKNKIINDVIFLKNAVAFTGNKRNQEIGQEELRAVVDNWGKEYDEANNRNNDLYAKNWLAEHDWYVGKELPTYAQPLKHETSSIMGTDGYPSLKTYFDDNVFSTHGMDLLGERTDLLMKKIQDADANSTNEHKFDMDKLIEESTVDGKVDWEKWKKLNRERIKNQDEHLAKARTVNESQAPETVKTASRGGVIYASRGSHINFQPKGTDTVPAMLTPGEFVVNRQSTQQNLPVLKAINSGTYSHGDIVRNLSRGGLSVPRYYLNGTNNGVPATGQGPSQGSSQAFDFTSFMNTFKDMLKTGLDTLKSLSPQPSGVSDSSQGSVSSIDNFVSRLDKIATTLASLNIPPEIKITGTHDVNVIINGDTVLNQLKPDLADIVASSIKKAFQDFKALNPSSSETMNFDI